MICSTRFVSRHGDKCDILPFINKPLAHLAFPARSTVLIEARAGSLTLSNTIHWQLYASLTTYDLFTRKPVITLISLPRTIPSPLWYISQRIELRPSERSDIQSLDTSLRKWSFCKEESLPQCERGQSYTSLRDSETGVRFSQPLQDPSCFQEDHLLSCQSLCIEFPDQYSTKKLEFLNWGTCGTLGWPDPEKQKPNVVFVMFWVSSP
jgi:hypothetical protein